ncbi:condensation domain-containing protein, partial [Streptomyces albidoflavus]
GEKRLVGYVVLEVGVGEVDAGELRRHVSGRLPEFMVPVAVVVLEEMPLSASGKVDRRVLPAPDFAASVDGSRGPRTAREELLCGLFAEVLGLESVGVGDDFFVLGGHSLLATRLTSRLRTVLGKEVPVRALFEAPTVLGLLRWLESAGGSTRCPIRPVVRPERVPLSYAQQRLWFLHKFEGPSATYNMPLALRLTGELDILALEAALADVVGRHEALRTVFPDIEGRPYQQVLDPDAAWPGLETRSVAAADLNAALGAASAELFDLAAEAPLRATLFMPSGTPSDVTRDDHTLLLLLHHIAGDGWSLGQLAGDLISAYTARRAGRAPEWKQLPVQYADYTLWQRQYLGNHDDPHSALGRQLAYWQSTLNGLPEEIQLPTDRPRPLAPSHQGGQVTFVLPANTHRELLRLAQDAGASLFMVLQAGLAALLHKLGAGADIPIGSPIAGRTDTALDHLIGFFVNTLVYRVDTSGAPSFGELLRRVRATALDAHANQDVPFEQLVETMAPTRNPARQPLFQVMLTVQKTESVDADLPGLSVESTPVALGMAKFDLLLSLSERLGADGDRAAAGIEGVIEYAADLFDRETVEALAARLVWLLEQVVVDVDRSVGSL